MQGVRTLKVGGSDELWSRAMFSESSLALVGIFHYNSNTHTTRLLSSPAVFRNFNHWFQVQPFSYLYIWF